MTPEEYLERLSKILWCFRLRDGGYQCPGGPDNACERCAESERFSQRYEHFKKTSHRLRFKREVEGYVCDGARKAGLIYLCPSTRLVTFEEIYGFQAHDAEPLTIISEFYVVMPWLRAKQEAVKIAPPSQAWPVGSFRKRL